MPEDVFRWVVAAGVAIACIAFVVQAVVLVTALLAAKKAQQAAKEAQGEVMPLVHRVENFFQTANDFVATAGKLLEENRPRISSITADAASITKAAHEHAERIGELIDETSDIAKARIAQIDQTVGNAVEQVEHATESVKSAVLKPVKEVNGLVAGVKAAFSTYAQGGNRNSPEHATQDEEMFI
jgi:ABC-type transporter Mla subunit MlaD